MECREGYRASGDLCYRLVDDPQDWHTAAITCGMEGAVLARYDDSSTAEFLQGFLDTLGVDSTGSSECVVIFTMLGFVCVW